MNKYLTVLQNSFQEHFAYRLNFILWRVRMVVSVLISFFLWQTVFQSQSTVFGYQAAQMLTYILLITFISSIVLSTQTFRVAEEINFGRLSDFLIRPISYFGYVFARDVADKLINTIFSFFEIGLLILLLRPPLMVQKEPLWLVLFLFATIIAAVLYFEIGMLLSFIGFWSRETWAPRFVFYILVAFLAGTYFPLDIFPPPIYNILQLLPFTYLVFFPLKIYLGSLNTIFLIKGFIVMSLWIIILWWLVKFLWQKGLKLYTAEGQ